MVWNVYKVSPSHHTSNSFIACCETDKIALWHLSVSNTLKAAKLTHPLCPSDSIWTQPPSNPPLCHFCTHIHIAQSYACINYTAKQHTWRCTSHPAPKRTLAHPTHKCLTSVAPSCVVCTVPEDHPNKTNKYTYYTFDPIHFSRSSYELQ